MEKALVEAIRRIVREELAATQEAHENAKHAELERLESMTPEELTREFGSEAIGENVIDMWQRMLAPPQGG